jgi:probable phosphoglycerate mutase
MAPQATTVLLVRHGETEYNRTNRYMGRLEEGLNERGREQAARAAERLTREPGVDALYTSPLQRTRETAGYLERALGLTARPEKGFLEMDLGVWEGRCRADVEAEDVERWRLWLTDPARVRVEGMEGVDACKARVGEALDRAVDEHPGGRIVVVTHFAGVVTALLHALDLPSSAYRRFPVDNTSFSELRMGRFNKLIRFNDTNHLSGVGIVPGGID